MKDVMVHSCFLFSFFFLIANCVQDLSVAWKGRQKTFVVKPTGRFALRGLKTSPSFVVLRRRLAWCGIEVEGEVS